MNTLVFISLPNLLLLLLLLLIIIFLVPYVFSYC